MDKDQTVVDAVVVPPVINPAVEATNAQKANFISQLEQIKKEMLQHQQSFDTLKTKGIKLEGAIESLDILLKSLS